MAAAAKFANPSVWANGDTVLINQLTNSGGSGESYCREEPVAAYRYFSAVLEEPGLVPAFPFGSKGGAVESVTRLDGFDPGVDPTVSSGWTNLSAASYSITTGSYATTFADLDSAGYVVIEPSYTLTSADTHVLFVAPYHQTNNDGGFVHGYYFLRTWVDSTTYTFGYAYERSSAGNNRQTASIGSYDYGAAAAKNEVLKNFTEGNHIWFAKTEGRYCITTCGQQAILYDLATATTGTSDASTLPVARFQVGYNGASPRTNYVRGLGIYRLTMAS